MLPFNKSNYYMNWAVDGKTISSILLDLFPLRIESDSGWWSLPSSEHFIRKLRDGTLVIGPIELHEFGQILRDSFSPIPEWEKPKGALPWMKQRTQRMRHQLMLE